MCGAGPARRWSVARGESPHQVSVGDRRCVGVLALSLASGLATVSNVMLSAFWHERENSPLLAIQTFPTGLYTALHNKL